MWFSCYPSSVSNIFIQKTEDRNEGRRKANHLAKIVQNPCSRTVNGCRRMEYKVIKLEPFLVSGCLNLSAVDNKTIYHHPLICGLASEQPPPPARFHTPTTNIQGTCEQAAERKLWQVYSAAVWLLCCRRSWVEHRLHDNKEVCWLHLIV